MAARAALDALAAEGLLSDDRFTESLVRERRERGHGPIRIRAELSRRGIDDALIDPHLGADEEAWERLCVAVRRRRFGEAAPDSLRERARQSRFLSYRGFTAEQIRRALRETRDRDSSHGDQ